MKLLEDKSKAFEEEQGNDVVAAALLLYATLFRSRKLFMTIGRLLLTSRPWYEQPGLPPTKRRTITRPFWMNRKED